jgi:hypothetical protein
MFGGGVGTLRGMSPGDPRLGPNTWLVEEMFERWRASRAAVDASWRDLFEAGESDDVRDENRGQLMSPDLATVAIETGSAIPETAAVSGKFDQLASEDRRVVADMIDRLLDDQV